MRVRKINSYLPVATHTRAASTPSQFDDIQEQKTTRNDGLNDSVEKSKRSQSVSNGKPSAINATCNDLLLPTIRHSLHHQQTIPTATATQTGSSNIRPSPELLAKLLKGSSEKLLSEQREEVFAVSLIVFYVQFPKRVCIYHRITDQYSDYSNKTE